MNGPLERRISVPGATAVFNLNARREWQERKCYKVLVTITSDDPGVMFDAKVTAEYHGRYSENVVTHVENTTEPIHGNSGYKFDGNMVIKVEFLNSIIPDFGDIKSYIDRGSQVTLVGKMEG